MAAYDLLDATNGLQRLVQRAVRGEEVVIADGGTPVARLVPLTLSNSMKQREFGGNLLGVTRMPPGAETPVWSDDELKEMGLA